MSISTFGVASCAALLLGSGCQVPQSPEWSSLDATVDAPGSRAPKEDAATDGVRTSQAPSDTFGDDESAAPTTGNTTSCDKVDVLFVVDNSASMSDEQDSLIASFPGFIAGIESLLGHADYHVGVVTTDDNLYNIHGCRRIGALTTRTGGTGSSDSECGPFTLGRHFFTVHDDIANGFACAAKVGIEGNGLERPIAAALAAIRAQDPIVAQCNRDFVRDGAILMLVLITDEDDAVSQGTPASWYERLVEIKGGREDRIIVLAIIGHGKPNSCPAAQWNGLDGAQVATKLLEFTGLFPYGSVGDVCASSYDEVFASAVVGIGQACGLDYTPR